MLFEKATKLPAISSPTGMMFLLVYNMRQKIEFQKSRALIQALMSQQGAQDENIKKVFEDLKEAFFPFDKNQRSAELKKMRQAVEYWVKQGPVVVEAQDQDGKTKRRRQSKLIRGQKDLETRQTAEQQGRMIQLDPFQQARRRARS